MSFGAGSEITEFGTPEAVVCAHAADSATPTAAIDSDNVPTPSPIDFAILLILICPPGEIECSDFGLLFVCSSLLLLDTCPKVTPPRRICQAERIIHVIAAGSTVVSVNGTKRLSHRFSVSITCPGLVSERSATVSPVTLPTLAAASWSRMSSIRLRHHLAVRPVKAARMARVSGTGRDTRSVPSVR